MNSKDAKPQEKTAKIIMVGESGVGKTSLLVRFCQGTFIPNVEATIGLAHQTKTIVVNREPVKCEFWDLAGQDRCKTITPSFYKGAQGVVLTYAVDSEDSFNKVETWMTQVMNGSGEDTCKILIGNKVDGPRKVSEEQGKRLAGSYNIKFFETSAVLSNNVDEAFTELIRDIKVNILDQSEATNRVRLANQERNNNNNNNQQSGCCS